MNRTSLFPTMHQTIRVNTPESLLNVASPIAMGILNATPDSFYALSRFEQADAIIKRVDEIIAQGGKIIDVGAYSSRPGAQDVTYEEEMLRLDQALSSIRSTFSDVIISVDTFRSKIAQKVVDKYNVSIINDISGGKMDNDMFPTIASLGVAYVLMHMKGNPQNMQVNPSYNNVTQEVSLFFSEQIDKLTTLGVNDIIIDPGFGFGKNMEHNFQLLSQLDQLKLFNKPILVGVSRKSLIYKTLNTTPEDSLNGTTVLNTIALQKGASILRVHDVKEAMDCINLVGKLQKN